MPVPTVHRRSIIIHNTEKWKKTHFSRTLCGWNRVCASSASAGDGHRPTIRARPRQATGISVLPQSKTRFSKRVMKQQFLPLWMGSTRAIHSYTRYRCLSRLHPCFQVMLSVMGRFFCLSCVFSTGLWMHRGASRCAGVFSFVVHQRFFTWFFLFFLWLAVLCVWECMRMFEILWSWVTVVVFIMTIWNWFGKCWTKSFGTCMCACVRVHACPHVCGIAICACSCMLRDDVHVYVCMCVGGYVLWTKPKFANTPRIVMFLFARGAYIHYLRGKDGCMRATCVLHMSAHVCNKST